MQAIIDALVKAGTLKSPLDAKTVVDTSVLDEVYGDKTQPARLTREVAPRFSSSRARPHRSAIPDRPSSQHPTKESP